MTSSNPRIRSRVFSALVFDGDDTLWPTQHLYTDAKEQFFALLAAQGFQRATAAAQLERIDLDNLSTHGFGQSRFPQSMAQCYVALASERGKSPEPAVLASIAALGDRIFRREVAPVPDAKPVLEKLVSIYRVFLLTKGDANVQESRVQQSGLQEYFDAVHIVATKGSREFQHILGSHNLSAASSWSVGNSLRSDIYPALAVGMKAIWVPAATWAYEDASISEVAGEYYVAPTLADILAIIL